MSARNDIWSGAYKIPWDDEDFSQRMLAEHLSQEHDLASRRTEWVDRQVEWIHSKLLDRTTSRILDLGCGPGLYSHRLSKLEHCCYGIDFGPASITYARQHNSMPSQCEFILGDIRHTDLGGSHDLAMMLYGELNVFSPDEASSILQKTRAHLISSGRLILEVQTPDAVERIGRSESSCQELQAGLFLDRPHRYCTENQWLPEEKVAIQSFTVTDIADGTERIYHNTSKAWTNNELTVLLAAAGFRDIAVCETWPCNTDDLVLWTAIAP